MNQPPVACRAWITAYSEIAPNGWLRRLCRPRSPARPRLLSDRASRAAPSPARCPRRAATLRARSQGPARAAGQSRRVRQTPVHAHTGRGRRCSPTAPPTLVPRRLRRRALAARAALTVPAALATSRTRRRGPAVAAHPPDSRARAGRLGPAARALRRPRSRLAGSAPGRCARWRGSKVALAQNRCPAQASLPTKAAPPVKRRFESSPARPILPLSAARTYAPSAQPRPSARAARRSQRARQTPVHVRGGFARAARALRRPRSRRRRGASAVARAAAASKVSLARNRAATGYPARRLRCQRRQRRP
jgi:hypothetical protein